MTRAASKAIHWHRSIDENAICWLTFDKAESAVNTLSAAVLEELAHELDDLQGTDLRGVVFESAKKTGFILGADIKEFGRLRDVTEATAMAGRGQALLGRLAELGVPTVAAIDGFALGGGLELALACDYRVAAESYERTLGLVLPAGTESRHLAARGSPSQSRRHLFRRPAPGRSGRARVAGGTGAQSGLCSGVAESRQPA
jgi:enoyl-CoA hydratase/carnithine racemase